MPPNYPIKISRDGRHLVDQDDAPFYARVLALWNGMSSASLADAKTGIDNCVLKGFNTAQINIIDQPSPHNGNGDAPFTTIADFTTPNPAYFTNVAAIVDYAATQGVCCLLGPCYLGFHNTSEGWYNQMIAMGQDKLRVWGRYIGDFLKNKHNIIWQIDGDRDPARDDDGNIVGVRKDLTRFCVEGILESSTVKPKLMTCHVDTLNDAMTYWPSEAWLSINSAYTFVDSVLSTRPVYYQQCRTAYQRSTVKPYIFLEENYENEGVATLLTLRMATYQPLLCGAAGGAWGNDLEWQFLSGFNGSSGVGSTGHSHQLILTNFIANYAIEKLVPDFGHTFVTSGFGTDGDFVYGTAAVAVDRSLGMCYISGNLNPVVDTTKVHPSATAQWFDPTNGAFSSASGTGSPTAKTFNNPGTNAGGDPDWVLVIA
jgi:hypothetical protein